MKKLFFDHRFLPVLFLLFLIPLAHTQERIDEAEAIRERLGQAPPELKLDLLLQIMKIQMMIKTKPDEVYKFGKEAIALAKKLGDLRAEAYAMTYQAHALWYANKKTMALKTMEGAISIFGKLDDQKGLIVCYTRLGLMYRVASDIQNSLKYTFQALQISLKIQDDQNTGELYYGLGIIYQNMGETDQARKNFEEAFELSERHGLKEIRAKAANNLGSLAKGKRDFQLALKYYQICLNYFQERRDQLWTAIARSNIGDIYLETGPVETGIQFLTLGLLYWEKIGDHHTQAKILLSLSKGYKKKGDFASAAGFLASALEVAEKTGRKEIRATAYEMKSDELAEQGSYEEALDFQKRSKQLRLEVFREEKAKEIARLQEVFHLRDLELENFLLEKTNQIEKMRRNLILIGFLLLLVLLGFLIKKYLYLFTFWKKQKYIGQYRIMEPLGSGGMGIVYKAHKFQDKNAHFAVKVMREEMIAQDSNIARFKREGVIIDRLAHPNIVRIHERGEHDGRLFLVMDYLPGLTLDRLLVQDGPFPVRRGLNIFRQVVEAVKEIHAKDIVHRDLKPSNIMISNRENNPDYVTLLDFGLSRINRHSVLTASGGVMGTLSYLPPEYFSGGLYTFSSDVYSLGLVLYEILTGTPLYLEETLTSLVQKIQGEIPRPPLEIRPDIPASLNDLFMKMTSKNPDSRPSAGEISRSLEILDASV